LASAGQLASWVQDLHRQVPNVKMLEPPALPGRDRRSADRPQPDHAFMATNNTVELLRI